MLASVDDISLFYTFSLKDIKNHTVTIATLSRDDTIIVLKSTQTRVIGEITDKEHPHNFSKKPPDRENSNIIDHSPRDRHGYQP